MVECLVPSDRKLGERSRGCERSITNVPTTVGWSHRRKRRTSGCERDWTCRTCENCTTMRGKREQCSRCCQAYGNSLFQACGSPRERCTPTEGCKASKSVHKNKHLVRCEARRYEYRLKHGRNPHVTTRQVNHEPERTLEGKVLVASETNPVFDRDREPVVASPFTASASAPIVTAHTSHTAVKRLRLEGEQHVQNRESSVTTPVPSHTMDFVSTWTLEHEEM